MPHLVWVWLLHCISKKIGYSVFGTSRNPKKYTQSIPFELLPLEITETNSIKACVAEVIKRKQRLDILINNAGVGITGPMEEINADAIASNFATNCFGPLQMAQAVICLLYTSDAADE